MSRCPPDLAEYILTLKQVDQRADMHPEGSVYVHTQVVVDRVATHCDIELSIAAMLHDTGKDRTTVMNEKTGMPKAPGHEKYSAECVSVWGDWIMEMGARPHVVHCLVFNHMQCKLESTSARRVRHLMSQEWWGKLKLLMAADRGGTCI